MKEDEIIVNLIEVFYTESSFKLYYCTFCSISLHPSHIHSKHQAEKHEAILVQCIQQLSKHWLKRVLLNPVKVKPKQTSVIVWYKQHDMIIDIECNLMLT